jgi:secondary thiamine-phosphate synthase enzyme
VTPLTVETTARFDVVDITDFVAQRVPRTAPGIALVYLRHTTAALVLGPNDDSMRRDYMRVAERWLGPLGPFEHNENDNPNGAAHVLSSFGGVQLSLPFADGKLDLGTWQRILLLELDGPQKRTVCMRFHAAAEIA